MRTPQWIKKLGGHAGELYVAAELSKRGIPNSLLPENFSDDDILIGTKDGRAMAFVQVKSCHPDRAKSFILKAADEKWVGAPENQYVVFVWLGSPQRNENPQFWIAPKTVVGKACREHRAHGTENWERRFYHADLRPEWKDNWGILRSFMPAAVDGYV
jgi:hypothetical protein